MNTRRRVLRGLGASAALASAAGCSPVRPLLKAVFQHDDARVPPFGTRAFVQRCFQGLDKGRVWDNHVHVFGDGRSGTGCWVNPKFIDGYPRKWLYDIYLAAGGVEDTPDAEDQAIARLIHLQRLANRRGKVVLLAFDWVVDEQGQEQEDVSTFFTPQALVRELAERYPDVVEWGASVHPYRADAKERIEKAGAEGAVCLKWLPNSQGIDPASPLCKPAYRALADAGMPLLIHAGHEAAAEAEGAQALGDVRKVRAALDEGVKVIVAHCAGLGTYEVERAGGDKEEMESYALFRELLAEKQYEGRLFADISAMTQFNRTGRALTETIVDQEIHPRLINGSDYPLPAIRGLVSTGWLEREGYLSADDAAHCDRVFEANPLLYDFVVKRSLRVDDGHKEHRLSDVVFESARVFACLTRGSSASPCPSTAR